MATDHDTNTTGQIVQLLNRSGLAKTLNCSLRTIDNLQAKGMPSVPLCRSRRFIADEVIAWLKRKGGAK
jgi:phage terminase Nu1 subunit (DNA packaging protein)